MLSHDIVDHLDKASREGDEMAVVAAGEIRDLRKTIEAMNEVLRMLRANLLDHSGEIPAHLKRAMVRSIDEALR